MSQTKEKWDSLALSSTDTFKRYEDAMILRAFIFIFCLEPTVSEQVDENDFRLYYGNFFESTILKLLEHSYVRSSFTNIKRYFDNGI